MPAPLRLIPRLGGVFDFLELKLDDGALQATASLQDERAIEDEFHGHLDRLAERMAQSPGYGQ